MLIVNDEVGRLLEVTDGSAHVRPLALMASMLRVVKVRCSISDQNDRAMTWRGSRRQPTHNAGDRVRVPAHGQVAHIYRYGWRTRNGGTCAAAVPKADYADHSVLATWMDWHDGSGVVAARAARPRGSTDGWRR